MDEDKSWMGATPSMFGRQLKKPKVKFFFQLLPEYKKLKLAELKRRVIVENLCTILDKCLRGVQRGVGQDHPLKRGDEETSQGAFNVLPLKAIAVTLCS